MPIEERRMRERAARHRLILDTARNLAESEGWDAVTTRRLSTEIEYSQPVLYKHFANMEAIAEALAVEGFGELAAALRAARTGAAPQAALAATAHAYLSFARDNPALYDAMFLHTTRVRFGVDDTPASLTEAFGELRAVIAGGLDDHGADTTTEVLWATLHGLTMLDRGGRLRPHLQDERVEQVVARFAGNAVARQDD